MSEGDTLRSGAEFGFNRAPLMGSSAPRLAPSSSTPTSENKPNIPQIRFVPYVTNYARSLHFEALDREVPPGLVLKVGRYTDKVQPTLTRIAFKSKVVSRAHAEIWSEGGQFFLRDTKSSSGTFLNQQRLSPPNQESAPHLLKDGDILQLGVDYQGGTQGGSKRRSKLNVFRCVKIRLEINRSWQRERMNPFRGASRSGAGKLTGSDDLEECCICLCSIAAFQALFVAPCSHTFHYKCIRRLLLEGPAFVCPLCRTYADLESDVCVDELLPGELDSLQISSPSELASRTELNRLPRVDAQTFAAPPALESSLPGPENARGFSNEHQECRTPANPTPHLLFAGPSRGVAPTRSLSASLTSEPEPSSTLRSPALGELDGKLPVNACTRQSIAACHPPAFSHVPMARARSLIKEFNALAYHQAGLSAEVSIFMYADSPVLRIPFSGVGWSGKRVGIFTGNFTGTGLVTRYGYPPWPLRYIPRPELVGRVVIASPYHPRR
ncbi:hypothetical protein L0F63_004493 [Massospora cicadina]|nr:hypothetical protein L0F63_004493 [Massospora cicadina]